jgi:hypothetical protein
MNKSEKWKNNPFKNEINLVNIFLKYFSFKIINSLKKFLILYFFYLNLKIIFFFDNKNKNHF